MKDEALRLALKLAFRMGQDYWYHADHEFSSYHKKADAIRAEFDQLVEKTIKQALANDALDRMADNERELGIQMQPEPEPVAQVVMYSVIRALKPLSFGTLLYAAPPKLKPLTDEQKLALCKQFPDHLTFNAIKAIEAAHGIKE